MSEPATNDPNVVGSEPTRRELVWCIAILVTVGVFFLWDCYRGLQVPFNPLFSLTALAAGVWGACFVLLIVAFFERRRKRSRNVGGGSLGQVIGFPLACVMQERMLFEFAAARLYPAIKEPLSSGLRGQWQVLFILSFFIAFGLFTWWKKRIARKEAAEIIRLDIPVSQTP